MGEPTVAVGRVMKAHGDRGEVAVENRSDNPDRWTPGSVLFDERGADEYRVKRRGVVTRQRRERRAQNGGSDRPAPRCFADAGGN